MIKFITHYQVKIMNSKKIIIVFFAFFMMITQSFSQKTHSTLGVGKKYYFFNDWGTRVISSTFITFNYTYAFKKDVRLGVDFDIFRKQVGGTVKYPIRDFFNSAYLRRYISSGLTIEKSILPKFYINAGLRLRYAREEHILDEIGKIYAFRGYELGFQLGANYDITLSKHFVLQPELGYHYYTRFTHSQYYLGMRLGYTFLQADKKKKS